MQRSHGPFLYYEKKLYLHHNPDVIFLLAFFERNYGAGDFFTVNGKGLNALFGTVGHYFDVVNRTAELTGNLEVSEILRNAGVNGKSLVSGIYAEDVL